MKKQFQKLMLALFIFIGSTPLKAQFNLSDVQYWIGSGTDSSILVVDFQDGTWDTSYAWGYLHDGTATGEDMLNDIAAADINFSVNISGGFLNDISYGSHSGIGGTGGFFWSTWSGTSMANLTMNVGISEVLVNGGFFACSFTDFNPAVIPGNPIAAFEPLRFTAQDIEFWVGTGTDSAVLVIDFHTSSGTSSYAWGYIFSGNATGEQMLIDIAAADPNLTVAIAGGFLNDITYGGLEGLGGNPNFWGTWSATNLGNWDFNIGIGETLQNGEFFGCSYTDFNPALRPDYPTAASPLVSVNDFNVSNSNVIIYPNPTNQWLNIVFEDNYAQQNQVSIVDAQGKIVWQDSQLPQTTTISVEEFSTGIYSILISNGSSINNLRFLKQ